MFITNKSILMQTVFACKAANALNDAKVFLTIAAKHSTTLEVLDEIAYLQSEIKDYTNSVETLKQCLNLAQHPEQKYAIRGNLAKVYNHLNDPLNSLINSMQNRNEEKTTDYNTLMEISFSYYLMGDYTTSEKMMREMMNDVNTPLEILNRVKYNLGSYDLDHGDFKKGLRGFVEVGHKISIWKTVEFRDIDIWDGSLLPGKTVLIHAEGGIGDEIINVRFMKNIKEMGMNPVWITNNSSLAEVFTRNGFYATTHINPTDYPDSVQCMAMYLPILLDLDQTELWTGPYLSPDKDYISKWEKLLPEGNKLAIKFAGSKDYDQDLHRSMPISFFKNLDFEGTLVNLQLEEEFYQSDMFNAGEHITNIEDTLAILSLCDSFVSSCTSVVHMAGAMGKNGVVCPPIACYYVWLGCSEKSNWYSDNLKVFRQTKHKDWNFTDKVRCLL